MARRLAQVMMAGATVALACSVEAPPPQNEGTGGSTSASSSQSSSAMSAVSAVSAVSSSAMSSSSGMMMGGCDPPAEAGSIYELADQPLNLAMDPVSMCDFRGEVMLVVNTAAA